MCNSVLSDTEFADSVFSDTELSDSDFYDTELSDTVFPIQSFPIQNLSDTELSDTDFPIQKFLIHICPIRSCLIRIFRYSISDTEFPFPFSFYGFPGAVFSVSYFSVSDGFRHGMFPIQVPSDTGVSHVVS